MTTALIADDEPLLAQALRHDLQRLWPELDVVAQVGDGLSAARETLRLQPQVLFLDIRMPGQDGLAAASQVADEWPADAGPLPLLVFVTAFEQHAVQAFEAQAQDYLLKPIDSERLAKTVQRLQARLQTEAEAQAQADTESQHNANADANTDSQPDSRPRSDPTQAPAHAPALDVSQWQALLHAASAALHQPAADSGSTSASLRFIQAAGVGNQQLHMVPVAHVLYFEAADKYVRVITADTEYLIRTPLRQLLAQLPHDLFWQVHRGVLVRADAIASVQREESGKMWLQLHNRPAHEHLPVGRIYAHPFKAM